MALKQKIFSLCLWLTILTAGPVIMTYADNSVTLTSDNTLNEVTLTITDAFYTDLDGDEVLDIVSYFDLQFIGVGRHVITIDVYLTLPSGSTFYYEWLITTSLESITCRINFFDHALETGIYKLTIDVFLPKGGLDTGTCEYEFDPPGSSGGGDPLATIDVV